MKTKRQIQEEFRLLGYYQIIGGIIGGLSILWVMINMVMDGQYQLMPLIVLGIVGAPFIFSIYAGRKCFVENGLHLLPSKINQIAQIISVHLFGLKYLYYSGVFLALGIETTEGFLIKFDFGLSQMALEYHSLSNHSLITINLVAFFLLYRIMNNEERLAEIIDLENAENPKIEEHLIC